jgi:Secretion system C-terminal sorting domain
MKKIYNLVAFLLATHISMAQMNYTFSASSGTYTPLVGASNATLTAITSYPTLDEGYENSVALGFTFNFNGTNYTTCGINTNGFITMGNDMIDFDGYYGNNLTNGPIGKTNIRPIIAPFWADLKLAIASDISYTTTGTSPNQVFTAQWNKAKWPFTGFQGCISIQVSLYEGSNIIEFSYRNDVGFPALGAVASIGICGAGVGNGNFLSLDSANSSPSVSSTLENSTLGVRPPNGQVYTFTPIAACTGTPIGGNSIASVASICDNQYFSLSLQGNSKGTGVTYEWQKSAISPINWMALPNGAIDSVSNASQTMATMYRCKVVCAASATVAYSNPVTVNMNTSGCPPTNDEIEGALSIVHAEYSAACTMGVAFSTITATKSPIISASFSTASDDDLWYKFTATSDKVVIRYSNIVATGTQGTNGMGFGIYLGTIGNVFEAASGSVPLIGGNGETFLYGLTIGVNYYVRLLTGGVTWRANGTICIVTPNISSGIANTCNAINQVTINPSNANNTIWVPLRNGSEIVGEINANGNNLGIVSPSVYVNTMAVRQATGSNRYYLDRNIKITMGNVPSAPVSVRIYYKQAELSALIAQAGSGVTNSNSLFVTKTTDGCGASYTGGGELISPSAYVNYGTLGGYVEFEVSSFSSFFLHGGAFILPSDNIKLTAKQINNSKTVAVNWTVISEKNVTNYDIETSNNGSEFVVIKNLKSIATNTNFSNLQYSSTCETNNNSIVYFRIKSKKSDGSFTFSNTVAVNNNQIKITINAIAPNPVINTIHLNLFLTEEGKVTFKIIDMMGKVVETINTTGTKGNNNLQLQANKLAKGIYMIEVTDKLNNKSNSYKLIKE